MIQITCPNCQASYEVPASEIPLAGREVHCSACGHGWVQGWQPAQREIPPLGTRAVMETSREEAGHDLGPEGWLGPDTEQAPQPLPSGLSARSAPDETPAMPQAEALAAEKEAAPTSQAPWQPQVDLSVPEPQRLPEPDTHDRPAPHWPGTRRTMGGALPAGEIPASSPPAAQPQIEASDEWDDEGDGLPQDAPLLPPPPKRDIDPNVLSVLRAEAALEAAARQRESDAPLETQGELPLPPPPPSGAASDLRARLARLQAAERLAGAARWTTGVEGATEGFEPDPPGPDATRTGFPPLPTAAQANRGPRDRSGVAAASVDGRAAEGRLPARLSPRDLAIYRERRARQGFRIGFAVPVALASAALALYLAAAPLAAWVPSAEPALARVIEVGDSVQARVADHIHAAFDRLRDL